jgi:transcriptional regulator with XRE-family HTH domain
MGSVLKQQAVGEHIRHLRKDKGLSLRSLARETAFSPSFLSQVENGQVSPSIGSMQKIATALGVSLGEFFTAAARGDGGLVVRESERAVLHSWWSSAEVAALSTKDDHRLEPVLVTLKPGGRSGKHPYPHPREEFALIIEGRANLTLGPERYSLVAGDAVTILPGELRLWENPTQEQTRVLIVSIRASSAVRALPV